MNRRLRPMNAPRPVQVMEGPAGHVKALRTSRGLMEVDTVLEEWRIDDEWWRVPISRRYLCLLLRSGRRVTVFQDLMEGFWYVQEG